MRNYKEISRDGSGFIKTALIVVGALVLLKYIYNIDVVGFLSQSKFKEFLDRFYDLGVNSWNKYSHLIIDFYKNILIKLK